MLKKTSLLAIWRMEIGLMVERRDDHSNLDKILRDVKKK